MEPWWWWQLLELGRSLEHCSAFAGVESEQYPRPTAWYGGSRAKEWREEEGR